MTGSRGIVGNISKLPVSIMSFNSMFLFPHSKSIALAIGLQMTTGEFLKIGERAFTLERLYNLREGLTYEDDYLPSRLMSENQQPRRMEEKERIEAKEDLAQALKVMLPKYYKLRGWNIYGIPERATLEKMGIDL